ncbi:unnamed protein product, partial [Amoebophrya sp. A120]
KLYSTVRAFSVFPSSQRVSGNVAARRSNKHKVFFGSHRSEAEGRQLDHKAKARRAPEEKLRPGRTGQRPGYVKHYTHTRPQTLHPHELLSQEKTGT